MKSSFSNGGAHPRQSRRRNRHFRHGQRAAARRALTAARLYLDGQAPSLLAAAESCGSCVPYVVAMVALIKAENAVLLNAVLAGHVPVLAAARQVTQLAELVTAYRQASAHDRVAFARVVGPTTLFDNVLVPASA